VKIPKTVTPAKKAANQDNAKDSTGASTIAGKGRASQNAITHGGYTRDMLLPGENEKEFKQLQSEMMSDYCPVGYREIRRVEKLTWNEWRYKRLRRGETGELAKLFADHDTRAEIMASTHTPQYFQAGTDHKRLEEIEEQINSGGYVSEKNLDWLRKLPYGDEIRTLLELVEIKQPAEPGEDAPSNPEMAFAAANQRPTRDKSAAMFQVEWEFVCPSLLSILDSLKAFNRQEQGHHGVFLIRRAEAQRNALLIPEEAVLNRITRCENHLLSNIERDENALERMQRIRRGEKVPTPTARAK